MGESDLKYIEIFFETGKETTKFIGAIDHELGLRSWSYDDLADALHRPSASIKGFIYGKHKSRFLAAEIANYLQIMPKEWQDKERQ